MPPARHPVFSSPAWALLLGTLLTNAVFYIVTCDAAGRWFLPLDDAFIYFQYARRFAELKPFSFQPGSGFTTGATSPLFPALLAPFALFVSPLRMAWVALLLSVPWKWLTAWGIHSAVRGLVRHPAPAWIAGLLVLVSGPFTYGVLNGMETGMLAASAAWALAALATGMAPTPTMLLLAVVSLSRPEGALVPLILLVLRPGKGRLGWRHVALSLVPGLLYVCLVWLESGGLVLATARTKMLAVHPFQSPVELATRVGYWVDRVGRLRLAHELVLPPLALPAMALGLAAVCRRRGLWPLAWLAPLAAPFTSVVPLLHDGRYFAGWLPILLALWSIGAWTVVTWVPRATRRVAWSGLSLGAIAATIASLPAKAQEFSHLANEMVRMHLAAADWLARELPPGPIVGIHDAGILTALGAHPTVDFNGLVTPAMIGAAGSGPGSVYQSLARLPFAAQPTHLASFPAFTPGDFRGPVLARFPVEENVWGGGTALTVWVMRRPWTTLALRPATTPADWKVVDELDHADLASEKAHGYDCREANAWKLDEPARLRHLALVPDSLFEITEGGRFCSDLESFTMQAEAGRPARLVLRCFSDLEAAIAVHAGDLESSLTLIPAPQAFQELSLEIPAERVTAALQVRVAPHRGGGPSVRDGLETYHAWLLQPGDGPLAAAREKEYQARRREFDGAIPAWNNVHQGAYVPLDEALQFYWHKGWTSQAPFDKPLPYRWILGNRAAMAFPVREVSGAVTLVIDGEAAEHDGMAAPNVLMPRVNGRDLEPVSFGLKPHQELHIEVPADAVHPGLNQLELVFKDAWSPRILTRGESDDDRELVMAVYAVRVLGAGFKEDAPVAPRAPRAGETAPPR